MLGGLINFLLRREKRRDKIKKPKGNIDPAFVLIMAIGLAACLFRLGAADLDIDESYTALVVEGGSDR